MRNGPQGKHDRNRPVVKGRIRSPIEGKRAKEMGTMENALREKLQITADAALLQLICNEALERYNKLLLF